MENFKYGAKPQDYKEYSINDKVEYKNSPYTIAFGNTQDKSCFNVEFSEKDALEGKITHAWPVYRLSSGIKTMVSGFEARPVVINIIELFSNNAAQFGIPIMKVVKKYLSDDPEDYESVESPLYGDSNNIITNANIRFGRGGDKIYTALNVHLLPGAYLVLRMYPMYNLPKDKSFQE